MRKKEIFWVAVLLILGGIYIRYFTSVFIKPQIGIAASIRPNRRGNSPVLGVFFTLNGDYKLTHLKVMPLEGADGKTFNPHALPVWDLISDSNSVPVRALRYGQPITGMKPALKGVHPDPLSPDVFYRLLLWAGDVTGYVDFRTKSTR